MRIAIFGTVGAGKTTLINNLKKRLPNYEVFWEPLEKNPYFGELYTAKKDIQRIAYSMEIWMLSARMKQLVTSRGHEDVLFDRGVMDTIIFADANHQLGRIDDRDYGVYEEYFEVAVVTSLFAKGHESYDLVVYLKVDDDTSVKRIKERGIKEELQVDENFWRNLNQTYEKWYEKLVGKVPFLVIDGNTEDQESLADEVVNYIKNNQSC